MLKVAVMWYMILIGVKDGEYVEKMYQMRSLEACQAKIAATFQAASAEGILLYSGFCMDRRMYEIYQEESSV